MANNSVHIDWLIQ